MIIKIFILIMVFLNFTNSNKSNENEYVFDFTIDKETLSGTVVSIDIFKATKNDEIIAKNDQSKYNHLEWISIGDAQIYQNNKQYFKFTASGVYMKIHLLNNKDKQLIKNEIFDRYNIEVNIKQTNKQIKRKKLNHIECAIKFDIEQQTLELKGTVDHYNQNPIEVYFDYKEDRKEGENKLFQKFLNEKKK